MRKIIFLMFGLMMVTACGRAEKINIEYDNDVDVDYPPPSENTFTICWLILRKTNTMDHYIKPIEIWNTADSITRQKYIDLGREVYKNHFYDVFDPEVYTREDSLEVGRMILNRSYEGFYLGYIYNRKHSYGCKERLDEDLLYDSPAWFL